MADCRVDEVADGIYRLSTYLPDVVMSHGRNPEVLMPTRGGQVCRRVARTPAGRAARAGSGGEDLAGILTTPRRTCELGWALRLWSISPGVSLRASVPATSRCLRLSTHARGERIAPLSTGRGRPMVMAKQPPPATARAVQRRAGVKATEAFPEARI